LAIAVVPRGLLPQPNKQTYATTTTIKPNIPPMQTSEANPSPTTKQPAKTTPKTKRNKIQKQKDVATKKPTTTQVEQNKPFAKNSESVFRKAISSISRGET
jgi:hypothetical protein